MIVNCTLNVLLTNIHWLSNIVTVLFAYIIIDFSHDDDEFVYSDCVRVCAISVCIWASWLNTKWVVENILFRPRISFLFSRLIWSHAPTEHIEFWNCFQSMTCIHTHARQIEQWIPINAQIYIFSILTVCYYIKMILYRLIKMM